MSDDMTTPASREQAIEGLARLMSRRGNRDVWDELSNIDRIVWLDRARAAFRFVEQWVLR